MTTDAPGRTLLENWMRITWPAPVPAPLPPKQKPARRSRQPADLTAVLRHIAGDDAPPLCKMHRK